MLWTRDLLLEKTKNDHAERRANNNSRNSSAGFDQLSFDNFGKISELIMLLSGLIPFIFELIIHFSKLIPKR